MKGKIQLDLSSLEVESFDTTSPLLRRRQGTVFGQAYTDGESTCFQIMCTCESDNGTCDASCQGGCGGTASCGCGTNGCGTGGPDTRVETCATGFQIMCSCP
jgi:hypothetical protein